MLAPLSYPNFIEKRIPKFIDFLIDFARILAPKISPKINTSRPWSTENPQELAREPGDHQKAPKMEPKVGPGPPKSDLCSPQGLQNGAPDTPKTSPKPLKIASQNATEMNPNFIQEAKKKHQKSTRMYQNWKQKWIQHGAQLEPNFVAQYGQTS